MEIKEIKIEKLSIHPINKKFFGKVVTTDRDALKTDIRNNGIKVALQITPDYQILAGATRFSIAQELRMKELPCQIIEGLDTEDQVAAYIIKDNLLRRQLPTGDRLLLFAELSHINERGRGTNLRDTNSGKFTVDVKNTSTGSIEDVIEKTAREVGVSESTIDKARNYEKKIKENPKLKELPVNDVLKIPTKKLLTEQKKSEKEEKQRKPVEEIKINYNDELDSMHIFKAKGTGISQQLGNVLISFDENNMVVGIRIRKFKELISIAK